MFAKHFFPFFSEKGGATFIAHRLSRCNGIFIVKEMCVLLYKVFLLQYEIAIQEQLGDEKALAVYRKRLFPW